LGGFSGLFRKIGVLAVFVVPVFPIPRNISKLKEESHAPVSIGS